jgi:hypothetical protein
MAAVLIASHTESGRVTRTACHTREECWEMADRVVLGWLRRVHGSRYQDPRAPLPSRAVAVPSRRCPFRFEVVSP